MAEGIIGKVVYAHLQGKSLDAKFISDEGKEYFIDGLSMVFGDTDFENKMIKMYHDGKCDKNGIEYRKVALRVHFPMDKKPPYHLSDKDFNDQEAYLYLNAF